jgi:hypothetical protein
MVMELNNGKMVLNMSVSGSSTKPVAKVNSGMLTVTFLKDNG